MTAIAGTTSDLCPVSAADARTAETTGDEHVRGLSRGQTAAVTLSVGLGVLVAGTGWLALMWRRMALRQVTGYRTAIDTELLVWCADHSAASECHPGVWVAHV
jgi:hypothetical protein